MKKWVRIDKGLRKDEISGKYEAQKRIKGKLYSKTFSRVRDARRWLGGLVEPETQKIMSVCELYEWYKSCVFQDLTISTRGIKEQRMKTVLKLCGALDISEITHHYLDDFVQKLKNLYQDNPRRLSFKKELDEIRAMFNWYREHEPGFINPVTKRHYRQGLIKKSPKKNKALALDQLSLFFSSFDSEIFRDFAITQYLCGARYGEIAGLQFSSIDNVNNELLIKHIVIENQSKKFEELKDSTKNGDCRKVPLSSKTLKDILRRRLGEKHSQSNYIFQIDGNYLNYRKVQYHYNKALRKAGLTGFSSTHIMRYSSATNVMRMFGTCDHVKAITGHKSTKLAQHYSQVASPLSIEVVRAIDLELSSTLEAKSIKTVGENQRLS